MIVTTRFPDLPPRPETLANAAFRRAFAARWGRENTVFLARARQFESVPLRASLSIKLIECGAAHLTIGRRQVLLQAGQCLVVNDGEVYTVRIRSCEPVQCFSLHFRPGLAAEVAAARRRGWERALQDGSAAAGSAVALLRDDSHMPSSALQLALSAVRTQVLRGECDDQMYEQMFTAVLDQVLGDDELHRHRADRALGAVRANTRDELRRRAGWASDFIRSNYSRPIALDDIANAAHLSKYHLLRVFHQLYGYTPLGLVRILRADAARKLVLHGSLGLTAVAAAAGFGSRWAMQRALRHRYGVTGRLLRQLGADDPADVAC